MEIKTWHVRDKKGVSLEKLSEMTGISKSTLNNIDNGITSPKIIQLEQIAKALNVRITDLFESEYK